MQAVYVTEKRLIEVFSITASILSPLSHCFQVSYLVTSALDKDSEKVPDKKEKQQTYKEETANDSDDFPVHSHMFPLCRRLSILSNEQRHAFV